MLSYFLSITSPNALTETGHGQGGLSLIFLSHHSEVDKHCVLSRTFNLLYQDDSRLSIQRFPFTPQ